MSRRRPLSIHTAALGLTLATGSLACSSAMLAELSAAPMDCPAERIEISDARQPWQGPKSWTATCTASEGAPAQTWFCSQLSTEVFCSDLPADAPSAADAAQSGP